MPWCRRSSWHRYGIGMPAVGPLKKNNVFLDVSEKAGWNRVPGALVRALMVASNLTFWKALKDRGGRRSRIAICRMLSSAASV